ncbi:hypothetical protein [Fictibacillus gelatini]|uniref:hypothetical protein n=1 Tax=Fictibacillus gelatini TaxID=225985 RepID=UPI0004230A79|nr:hypothetical protein [Fictibacillus gelatini]
MFFIMASFLPIVFVVVLIFMVMYAVKQKDKGGENVLKHVYIYLVLFATLMMTIGGGISIFMAVSDLVSPAGYYQSFSEFKEMKSMDNKKQHADEAEWRDEYQQMVQDEKDRTKDSAMNQLLKSFGFIVIPLPVFLYFNRMRKQT